jgi:hypothetical protein
VHCWPLSDSKWSSASKTFSTGELFCGVAVALGGGTFWFGLFSMGAEMAFGSC